MRKPVLHVILYLRAYLPLLESPVNICLKPEEGKLTLLSILVTLSRLVLLLLHPSKQLQQLR